MQGTAEKCRRRWKASAPWEHLTRLSCCKMDLELAPGEQGLDGGRLCWSIRALSGAVRSRPLPVF